MIQLLDLKSAGDEDYRALNEAIEETLGCLHGVLHNAALLGPRTPLEQYPTAKWLEDLKNTAAVPGTALSLYLHLPYCESRCWFCA